MYMTPVLLRKVVGAADARHGGIYLSISLLVNLTRISLSQNYLWFLSAELFVLGEKLIPFLWVARYLCADLLVSGLQLSVFCSLCADYSIENDDPDHRAHVEHASRSACFYCVGMTDSSFFVMRANKDDIQKSQLLRMQITLGEK